MAYEPIDGLTVRSDEERDERAPERRRRALYGVAVLVLLVVLVLVLLMLPRCSGSSQGGAGSDRNRRIIAVPDTDAEAGVVSVWIEEDRDIEAVLGEAGLSGADALDMGGGRFVVDVGTGTERESVRALRECDGVYDAGFVFPEEVGKTAR